MHKGWSSLPVAPRASLRRRAGCLAVLVHSVGYLVHRPHNNGGRSCGGSLGLHPVVGHRPQVGRDGGLGLESWDAIRSPTVLLGRQLAPVAVVLLRHLRAPGAPHHGR
eukprot:5880233-Pyramimonas_sp.AAC.1